MAAVSLIVMLAAPAAYSQFSPGPLSKPHQSLSASTQCASCHRVGNSTDNMRCLDCHTEIAQRLARGRGLHPRLLGKNANGKDCVTCHHEHTGDEVKLIRWDPAPGKFDHSRTGYPLEGKHATLDCRRCHNAQHIAPSERPMIAAKDLNHTFLGLTPACTSCHEDKHRGTLGQNCGGCHGQNEWKGASNFDHSKTKFPLTGSHSQVACAKCHAASAGPGSTLKFAGLAFDRCNACHTDPHHGAFQQTCQTCHNTSGWKRAVTTVTAHFDHSKTKFPLQGKHLTLECERCHAGGDFKKPLTFQNCADCHKDPHNGQFAKRAGGGECGGCHRVEGFKPAKFRVPEHQAAGFKLEGKHAAVPCEKCHKPAGKDTLFKVKFDECSACHADVHKGQFAAAPRLNRCSECHNVQGFKPSSFTALQHLKTRFPLVGGHAAVPCAECHKKRDNATPVSFQFADRSCSVCHGDPHRGRFDAYTKKLRADGTSLGCEACHSFRSFRDLSHFDHAATSYPLTGAHRATACAGCHRPPSGETKLLNVDFHTPARECETCHADIHGAQFQGGKLSRCADCHDTEKWKPSSFDHERSIFPLKGDHREVRCSLCHTTFREVEGRKVLMYKPVPTKCSACHKKVAAFGN